MVAKKRPSKRVTLQKKYKIIKRTKEHHKKLKKGIVVGNFKKKKTQDHIPNAWPYKDDMLKEIAAAKVKMEEVRLRKIEQRAIEQSQKKVAKLLPAQKLKMPNNDMDIEEDVENTITDTSRQNNNMGQNSRRAYLGELRKVVENADVILHVLDARDPLGTKSTAIEDMVLSHYRKKIVYVLNKADLVPREILSGWLSFLRKTAPAVPFKCNTQSQKGNLGRSSGKVEKQRDGGLLTNQAVGADELIGLLKNYARSGDTKTSISVGIVGFPNVGKSSLINSLLRSRAVGVSSTPGFTKIMQEVVLDKTIRLLDSPGIVFADGNSAATALRNCVNVDEIEDVLTPVQAIIEKCPQAYLMQLYSIPRFAENDVTAFLALVARGTGRLKKGGIPNIDAAARAVLQDWNSGKVKFYCKPPKAISGGGLGEEDTKILSGFSSELDIATLLADENRILDTIEAAEEEEAEDYVAIDVISSHVMDFQCENSIDSTSAIKTVKTPAASMDIDDVMPVLSSRKSQKMSKKKSNKDQRRGKVAEDYDFSTDFA